MSYVIYTNMKETTTRLNQFSASVAMNQPISLQIYPQCRLFPSVLKIKFVKKSSIRRDGTFFVCYVRNIHMYRNRRTQPLLKILSLIPIDRPMFNSILCLPHDLCYFYSTHLWTIIHIFVTAGFSYACGLAIAIHSSNIISIGKCKFWTSQQVYIGCYNITMDFATAAPQNGFSTYKHILH